MEEVTQVLAVIGFLEPARFTFGADRYEGYRPRSLSHIEGVRADGKARVPHVFGLLSFHGIWGSLTTVITEDAHYHHE